ncbi:hypothetical protein EJ04DRAFT_541889 [Polyplosphaeria fusca]|uniref:MYND-type domain-containing protein n=1 Tax=Polyplosphaeria fusca TaxID=682080 RepID=A0A9P4R0W9_9PLEO|nr:hypothetical protein EJ04DRAFT_541889 [Polyplosphaeria fusca]
MADSCAVCHKTANLKKCAKCQTTLYCSRDCQKADWKVHKKICSQNAAGRSSSSSTEFKLKTLEKHIPNPYTRIDGNKYLHDRPEQDVYKLLIDCFRLRQADVYNFEGHVDRDSVYAGNENSLKPFQRFLDLVSSRQGRMPPWWNADKQKECEKLGMDGGMYSLKNKMDKPAIIDRYGDPQMPMQLRMFGETIYGSAPGGQDGTMMRQIMMQAESGD